MSSPNPPRDYQRENRWLELALSMAREFLPAGGQQLLPQASQSLPPVPSTQRQSFSHVSWPGVRGCPYLVNRGQLAVIRVLMEAYQDGIYDVREDLLIRAAHRAGSDCVRLRDLFRKSDAWNRLIVQGSGVGTYRLPPLPEDVDEDLDQE